MSTEPGTIPCGQLAFPALVARVASTMDLNGMAHPPYHLKPGRCRFCDHALPYAYSAGMVGPDGELKRVEWKEGEPMGEKLQLNEAGALELGHGIALVYTQGGVARTLEGLRRIGDMIPPVLLATNGACDALTDEVFRAASVVARKRGDEARKANAARESARELQAKKAARAAAAQMARET